MLETAAWGAGIGLWETNFVTDTTRWFNDWCDRHDIDPCDGDDHVTRWDQNLHPDEGPEATRRFFEHVKGKAEYYDAEYRIRTRGGEWRWVFERGRVVERDAHGKAVRMLGVCMDLDETKVAERAGQRAQRACRGGAAANYRGRVGLGRRERHHAQHRRLLPRVRRGPGRSAMPIRMNWRQLLGTDPDQAIDQFRRRLQRVDPARARARDRIPLPPHRRQLALGAGSRLRGGTRRPTAPPGACSAWWSTSPSARLRETALSAADQRFRAIARELQLPDLRNRHARPGSRTGEGCERVSAITAAELPRAAGLGGAGASRRPAPAAAMVRPQLRVHGGAAVPHPPPRRPLRHPARFALRGARRRRQGGAHRRRGASTSASRRAPRRRCAARRNCCRWWPRAPATG